MPIGPSLDSHLPPLFCSKFQARLLKSQEKSSQLEDLKESLHRYTWVMFELQEWEWESKPESSFSRLICLLVINFFFLYSGSSSFHSWLAMIAPPNDDDILFAHLPKSTPNGSDSKYTYIHFRRITFSKRQPIHKLHNLKLKVFHILQGNFSNSTVLWLKKSRQQMNHDRNKIYNLIETAK